MDEEKVCKHCGSPIYLDDGFQGSGYWMHRPPYADGRNGYYCEAWMWDIKEGRLNAAPQEEEEKPKIYNTKYGSGEFGTGPWWFSLKSGERMNYLSVGYFTKTMREFVGLIDVLANRENHNAVCPACGEPDNHPILKRDSGYVFLKCSCGQEFAMKVGVKRDT